MLADPSSPYTYARFSAWTAMLTVVHATATAALAARLYVRSRITRTYGHDDSILISGHVFNIVATGIFLQMEKEAINVPRDTPESYHKFSLKTMLSVGFYIQAGVCVKVAIAFWFLSVARSNIAHKAIILTPLIIYILAAVVLWAVGTFRCGVPVNPVLVLNEPNCAIEPDFIHYSTLTFSILNSACDWIFAAVPFWMVVRSKTLTRSQRISACFLVGLAVAGSMVSIARIPLLNSNSNIGPKFLSNQDLLIVFLLSIVETAVAVITISLATLKPLVWVVRRRLAEHASQSGGRSVRPSVNSGGTQRASDPSRGQPQSAVSAEAQLSWLRSVRLGTHKTSKSIHLDTVALGGIGILGGLVTVNEAEFVRDDGTADDRVTDEQVLSERIECTNVSAFEAPPRR